MKEEMTLRWGREMEQRARRKVLNLCSEIALAHPSAREQMLSNHWIATRG
jgi:hypothetical protein